MNRRRACARFGAAAMAVLRAAVIAMPSIAGASAPELLGFGSRAKAMAGAVTATSASHEAVYYNPAALAGVRRTTIHLGVETSGFSLSLEGAPVALDRFSALDLGFAVPIPFRGALADRVVLGFGFVLPMGTVLVADVPLPGEPRFVRVDPRAQTVSLMGALGVTITDGFALGGGFIALSELRGSIDVAPNETGKIGTTVRDELVAAYAPILGAQLTALAPLSLGLSFRGESTAEFDLPITADLGGAFPLPIPRLDVSGTAQYDPLMLTLGAAWSFDSGLLIAVDVAYEAWSGYPSPIRYTAVPAGFPAQPEPGFSDVLAARAGAELSISTALGLTFEPRVGLAVRPTPVPSPSRGYLDGSILAGGIGLGGRAGQLTLDLAAALQLSLPRSTALSDPVPGLPRPSLAGRSVDHGATIASLSLELGVEL
ncbi:MAG: hypothetical protein HYV07_33715 [Deltaproteobacteria bacterium]|nr:hypothetical protein [Deltaproteobacteria bacterium]